MWSGSVRSRTRQKGNNLGEELKGLLVRLSIEFTPIVTHVMRRSNRFQSSPLIFLLLSLDASVAGPYISHTWPGLLLLIAALHGPRQRAQHMEHMQSLWLFVRAFSIVPALTTNDRTLFNIEQPQDDESCTGDLKV